LVDKEEQDRKRKLGHNKARYRLAGKQVKKKAKKVYFKDAKVRCRGREPSACDIDGLSGSKAKEAKKERSDVLAVLKAADSKLSAILQLGEEPQQSSGSKPDDKSSELSAAHEKAKEERQNLQSALAKQVLYSQSQLRELDNKSQQLQKAQQAVLLTVQQGKAQIQSTAKEARESRQSKGSSKGADCKEATKEAGLAEQMEAFLAAAKASEVTAQEFDG